MDETANQPNSTPDLQERLNNAKSRFTPADRETKCTTLRALQEREVQDIPALIRFHEILCFVQAYPDSPEVLQLVDGVLQRFAARVDLVKAHAPASDLKGLRDTGIVHTTVYYPYPYPIAHWLVKHFSGDVEIDWEDKDGVEKVRTFLPLLALYAENTALDDERLSLREWVRLAKDEGNVTDLQRLLELLERSPLSPETRRHLYESAELLLRWELRDATASRTQAKLPVGQVFYHRGPLKRGRIDFKRAIRKPLPGLKTASPGTAEKLIHTFRCALSVRNRELHPLVYANPQDVFLADAGRGLQLVLVGVAPEFRLPLEAYYSFLVLKNGVPVSYGGGAPLFDRLEIAGNIFESFRQGESVYIYSQVFRAYHHLCGSRHFLVERYQVGYENEEAIQSGAFWFYHKLGFRPTDPDVLAISEKEHKRITAEPAYRSSQKTLEQLAKSDMVLSLDGEAGEPFRDLQQAAIGLLVTREIAQRYSGNRAAAVQGATRRVARILRIPRWRSCSGTEQMAFKRWSPILALIPDLAQWTSAEKRALVQVIKAKGGRSEAPYVRLLKRHTRLAHSLHALAASASSLATAGNAG